MAGPLDKLQQSGGRRRRRSVRRSVRKGRKSMRRTASRRVGRKARKTRRTRRRHRGGMPSLTSSQKTNLKTAYNAIGPFDGIGP